MANLNNNIQADWDGSPGSLVQGYIKSQFESNIEDINKAIKDISFETDEDGKTVNWLYSKVGGGSTTGSFTLIPLSSYKIILDSLNGPSYVKPGEDTSISFTYHIENEDSILVALNGALARITVTNGNNSKPVITRSLDKSLANSLKLQTISIPANYLSTGVNSVEIELSLNAGGGSAEFIDDSDTSLKICSFDFKFDSTLTGGINYNEPIASAIATFGMSFTYKDGVNNLVSDQKYQEIISLNNIEVNIYNNTRSITKTITGKNTVSDLTLFSIQGSANNTPTYIFYILAVLTFSDGTTVYSNVNKYSMVCLNNGAADYSITSPQFMFKISNFTNYVNGTISAENKLSAKLYDSINIPLFAYLPESTTFNYTLNNTIIRENEAKNAGSSVDLSWSNLILTESGNNEIIISSDNSSFSLEIDTESIGSNITVPTDNLILSLSSNGKVNSESNQSWNYGSYSTEFSNLFDWQSNGWVDGALVVNNEAQAIVNCKACGKIGAKTVSIKFKTSNENTNEKLISCLLNNTDGFEIYPLKAIIYRGGVSSETEFTSENSEKEITFVWYDGTYNNISLIYINGTSLIILDKAESLSCNSNIVISANHTTLYLYEINVYNRALNFSEILALYKAHSTDDIVEYIKSNAIFNSLVGLEYNGDKVTIDSLPVGSKYVLIKANQNGYNKPWEAINQLPKTKTVGGKTTETKSWRLLVGPIYYITKVAEGEAPCEHNFYADKGTLSGLGTSSMAYPIKNFRFYFDKKITDAASTGNSIGFGDCFTWNSDGTETTGGSGTFGKTSVLYVGSGVTDINSTPTVGNVSPKKYQLSDNSIPADVFCLKADYAESSGVHNTGFAKLANEVMETTSNIASTLETTYTLPLNNSSYNSSYKVRSTIDGEQVYLFFADQEGNIIYHGKYNLNNEKASPDVYGFVDINDSTVTLEYFSDSGIYDYAETLKGYFSDTESAGYDNTHDSFNLSDSINPNECWEFSTNDATEIVNYESFRKDSNDIAVYALMGAFTYPYSVEEGYPFYNDPVFGGLDPFTAKTTSGKLAWFNSELAWEFRYPDGTGEDEYELGTAQPMLLKSLYKWVHKNNVYLWPKISDKNKHAAIFANNLHLYFNVNYLLKYYMMTKLFVCADLRIKNCMLAFYYDPNAEVNNGTSLETEGSPMGKMRAYYIFYDNDTILGVDNSGGLTNDWDVDELHGVFQGIDVNGVSYHGIWGNLEYCYNLYINNLVPSDYPKIGELGELMEKAYAEIRSKVTEDTINEYLSSSLPDAASNVDEDVKYFWISKLNPASAADFINGSDNSGKLWSDFNSESLKQYQGTRQYHRERFLKKRLYWFDSMYHSGTVDNYKIKYKAGGTTDSFADGTCKLTPEFNKWRFYLQQGEGNSKPIGTNLLLKGQEGTLKITSMVLSYPANIEGLYGCAKLDLSGWYGNLYDLTDTGIIGTLAYLKEFILGPSNDTNKLLIGKEQLAGFVSSLATPNLIKLTLQNISNSTNNKFNTLSLTNLNRLTDITINNVNVDVTLPNSSALKRLALSAPSTITLTNKDLESISIQDSSNLNKFTISHCNNTVYEYMLYIIKNNIDIDNLSVNITFGIGEDPDILSDNTLKTLSEIATLVRAKGLQNSVSVSGIGLNVNLNSLTDNNGNSCVSNITSVFTDLTLQDNDTSEFLLYNAEQNYILKEGGSIIITSTKLVDENGWSFEIDGSAANTLDGLITVDQEASSRWQYKLNAAKSFDNISRDHTLIIKATRGGQEVSSDVINIRYIPINRITLTPDNQIASQNVKINISINSESTKAHILKYDYVETPITGLSINYSSKNNNPNVSLDVNSDGIITGINYIMIQDQDDVITFTLNSITGKTSLYYDKVAFTKSLLSSNTSLNWAYSLLAGNLLNLNETITRSALYKLNGLPWGGITLSREASLIGLDLTTLLYFNLTGTFTLPNFPIEKITIPEGITSFIWTSVASLEDGEFLGYKLFIFPSTLQSAKVTLNFTGLPEDLLFDLSKTLIKRIYNASLSTPATGIFDLSITTVSSTASSDTYIFGNGSETAYPSNLEILGNYSEEIALSPAAPNGMFSRDVDNISSGTFGYLYKLGCVMVNDIKIGNISSFTMNNSPIEWDTQASYVKGLYYTFYKGSGVPTTFGAGFTRLTHIGDFSFGRNALSESPVFPLVKITNNVLKIGYAAFLHFDGDLTTQDGSQIVNLPNLTDIGGYAFNMITESITFTFNNVKNYGERAFLLDTGKDYQQIINITGDSSPTNLSLYAFGADQSTSIKNILNISNLSVYDKFNSIVGSYVILRKVP